jgi:DNA modification methylase
MEYRNQIINGNATRTLESLPAKIFQTCVTSPPYYKKREYHGGQETIWGGKSECEHEWTANMCPNCGAWKGELGQEDIVDCMDWASGGFPCTECYICHLRRVFMLVNRSLRDDGTLWIVIGDSYAKGDEGIEATNICGIPFRLAMALQKDGWSWRSNIVWHKENPVTETTSSRPHKTHETVLFFTKSNVPLYWEHPTEGVVRSKPSPDYYWVNRETKDAIVKAPVASVDKYMRKNLWRGKKYYYDEDATRQPYKESSIIRKNGRRLSKKYDDQEGSAGAGGGFTKLQETEATTGELYPPHPMGRPIRDVWTVNLRHTAKGHYAAYPEELIAPCILSGTSPFACGHCQSPYLRIVEREPLVKEFDNGNYNTKYKADAEGKATGYADMSDRTAGHREASRKLAEDMFPDDGIARQSFVNFIHEHGNVKTHKTTGWRPSCACEPQDNTGKCLVLDPFVGSGTTAIVAAKLHRDYTGIDVSEKYCELAKKRIAKATEQLTLNLEAY